MKNILLSSLFAATFAFPAISFSQDAAGGATAETVGELLKIMGVEKTMNETTAAILPVVMAQLKQAGLPADANKEVEAAFEALMGKVSADPDIITGIQGIYQKEFTDAEVNDLIAFYKTPTGKKMLARMGPIMAESAQIGQSTVQKYLPDFQTKIGEIVQKYRK